jgi:hypothetical protein
MGMALALFCLTACVPSVNPFYTQRDLSFDSRLLGTWMDKSKPDQRETWQFEQEPDQQSYKLTFTEKEGKRGRFKARLFKLKDELFLDLVPAECEFAPDQADLVGWAVIPGHLIVRVPQLAPELKLAFPDYEWLSKHLEKNPGALAHRREENHLTLTASTPELQRFVLKHLREGELFQEPQTLARQ